VGVARMALLQQGGGGLMSTMAERYCTSCGAERSRGSRSCVQCGRSFRPLPEAEVLGEPTPPQVTRKRRWPAGRLLFALVPVAAALIIGDWAVQNVEMRALVSDVETSEQAMITYQSRVQRATSAFEDLPAFEQDESTVQGVLNSVEGAASSSAAKLIATDAEISSVKILPWHGSLIRARDTYLDHSAAWRDHLVRVASDGSNFAERAPTISGTFVIVRDTLPAALPVFPWSGLDERVADIIDD